MFSLPPFYFAVGVTQCRRRKADLLVTYLTPDLGVRKAFAKSARKVKSRFGSSLEPLTHSRITFLGKEDAELPRLTQSDILRPHQGLREGLACFAMASEMVDFTKNSILTQAATAMLAQANVKPQSVLQLLG